MQMADSGSWSKPSGTEIWVFCIGGKEEASGNPRKKKIVNISTFLLLLTINRSIEPHSEAQWKYLLISHEVFHKEKLSSNELIINLAIPIKTTLFTS